MKSDAKKSVFWSGLQNVAHQGINFIITVIIARILTPEDYGLIAMLTIFFALAQAFIDSGLSGALIQKKDCTEKDYNSVFIFAVGVSVLLYVLLFLCAPLIAQLYNNSLLISLSRVYLFCLVINAVGIVPMTIMHKNLEFKKFAIVTIGINILSGVIAIIAAYSGMAYWALVIQILVNSSLTVVLFFVVTKWKPTLKFSCDSFRQMISYGFPVMLTSVIHAIYNNIYSLVIGAKYESKELGLYNRAYTFSSLIPSTFSNFTMRAMFPVLARIQDSKEELKQKCLEMLHLSLFVVVPVNFYMIFNGGDVVRIVLGEKWMELTPYMSFLCVSCISYVYTNLHMTIYKIIGTTKDLFISETIRKVLGILTLIITLPYGVMTMVYGLLLYSVVDILISSFFVKRSVPMTLFEQAKESITPLLYSLISGSICFGVSLLIHNLYVRFAACTLLFFCCYALLSLLFKERGFYFVKTYFKS